MIYEMMNLNEEALIHYDEVDALMNQLMNKIKTSGKKKTSSSTFSDH